MIMDLSSDSDDCQLYTKTADNVAKKKKLLDEDRNELVLRMKFLPDEQVPGYSHVFDRLADSPEPPIASDPDIVLSSSDSEDEIPLAQLRSSLRSGRKKHKAVKLLKPKNKSKKSTNRGAKNNSDCVSSNITPTTTNRPNTNEIPTIIFDDDTGYPISSFPPIQFNKVSNKVRPSTENDDIISLDESLQANGDENEEDLDTLVKISIDWRIKSEKVGFNIKHFQLRRYQKFETIFEELAEMEGVPINRVVIMRNFETIRPRDTPASLNLTYYGHLIGRISSTEVDHSLPKLSDFGDDHFKKPPEEELTVKLLLDSKKSLSLTISKTQKMNILYKKCSEELKIPDSKIKISFDGEIVEHQDSVSDLGIEDGDVMEVLIKKER